MAHAAATGRLIDYLNPELIQQLTASVAVDTGDCP